MKTKIIFLALLLFTASLFANEPPIVENVVANQRTDGSGIVDIYYDISDADGDTLYIELKLSEDGGNDFTIEPANTSGDIGIGILQGTGKYIIWEADEEDYTLNYNQFQFKVIAYDYPAIDIDGNVYKTVHIGDQIWMAENLKVTRYRNGDAIPYLVENESWISTSTGAYCVYGNMPSIADTYGNMYNWYAVDESRNIAPIGWHIPTVEEWQVLFDYLGGDSVAGGKMKETGTIHWFSPNTGATNESGFTGLPGGYRNAQGNGTFYGKNAHGHFWSSTESGNYGYKWVLISNYTYVDGGEAFKRFGYSVRCVRD